ncbi:MAG TPA: 2,3-bisphosphoglycerate-independent phosphoglycerate mutase [Longimicrobiales bacterium]|nr:2,3-bisphosphoglycerate-independent phosphoglycerate mutase [Longimicrobiales bacterium]
MSNVLLVILDGWGHSDFGPEPDPGNAVEQASVPRFRELYETRPRTRLACSGEDVGLPAGQMGNSEVGHLNLGAGRVVYQAIARIDRSIADGTFRERLGLGDLVARARVDGRALHLIGLVSDGGVHSHIRHLEALLDLLPPDLDVRIHCITDGRDTSPTSGAGFVRRIAERCRAAPGWSVATVSGRYHAMDRDRRWDRTERAWRCIARGESEAVEPGPDFLERRYAEGVTDEFLPPTVIAGAGERGIREGDPVVFFNFRADRMRQICSALTVPAFHGFERPGPLVEGPVTFTEYEPDYPVRVAFPPQFVRNGLGEVLADAGMAQLRVAETEKYAHVTYFFNGGEETAFDGEERILVPSPKVATYDLQPEMSAEGVCDTVVRGIEGGRYPFILVNFANPDMVGHTGVIPAAVKAVETVDACLGRMIDAVESRPGWVALVTADHGNCEQMLQPDGSPHTAHTTEPVDLILVDPSGAARTLADGGRLADVAPTALHFLGLEVPPEMTGRCLVRD